MEVGAGATPAYDWTYEILLVVEPPTVLKKLVDGAKEESRPQLTRQVFNLKIREHRLFQTYPSYVHFCNVNDPSARYFTTGWG